MKLNHSTWLILLAVLFILLTVTIYVIYKQAPRLLASKIEEELVYMPGFDGSFKVRVDDIKFGMFFSIVRIPATTIFTHVKVDNDSEAEYYRDVLEIGIFNAEISMKPVLLWLLGQKSININTLNADSVSLSVHNYHNYHNYHNHCCCIDLIYQNYAASGLITKAINRPSPENLNARKVLTNAQMNQQSFPDTSRIQIHSGQIHFAGRIEFPGQGVKMFEKMILKEHSFQVSNASFTLPYSLYSFSVDSISFNGEEGKLSAERVRMLPLFSREEFYRHVEYETDRIKVDLERFEVSGFRTFHIQDKRVIEFSQADLKDGTIDVYRDRRPPFDEQQRPVMLSRIIGTAPFGLYAGMIRVTDVDIFYSELPADPGTPDIEKDSGKIPFHKLNAAISNITNLADSLEKDSIMHIRAETVIFGEAMLNAEFRYDLKDLDGTFNAAGELSELQFESINKALYPLAGIKVRDGLHRRSVFSFSGNDTKSEGELYMYWSDLELDLTPDEGGIVSSIASMAGELLYHRSNPEGNDNSPSGKIEFERDTARFVFHYWWNCYLSGIKNSVLRDFVPL